MSTIVDTGHLGNEIHHFYCRNCYGHRTSIAPVALPSRSDSDSSAADDVDLLPGIDSEDDPDYVPRDSDGENSFGFVLAPLALYMIWR